MQRMLIVDDEPVILDGLYAFFQKANFQDMEIIKAHSAFEAIEWLNSVKVDIVLSDICMPGMDGMELIEEIMDRWPRCKVLLLTGHNEFDYAHQAIRNPCVVDYLLKTEGMSLIRTAVERALAQISEENDFRYQNSWFRSKLPRALPQLQRQLMLDLMKRTERHDVASLQEELDAVQLPFRSGEGVIPVIIRVEEWNNYQTQADRSLIRYAVANVAEELLHDKSTVKAIDLDYQVIACLIQPAAESTANRGNAQEQWEQTLRFVYGTLESVQQSCADCLNLSVSIMVSEQAVAWMELNQAIAQLRLSIHEGPGLGMEKLLRVNVQPNMNVVPSPLSQQAVVSLHLDQVKQHITAGDREWMTSFQKWSESSKEGLQDPFFRMKVYTEAGSILIELLHELGLYEPAKEEMGLSRMLHYDIHTPWPELVIFYQSAFEWMISKRSDTRLNDQSQILISIHQYIKHHLEDDLSLTRIAQEVSLNPSYLSRWYKRITGKGISEYIHDRRIERSKELLLGSSCKMHEISAKVGFSDQHYFYRFFKKATGCTPQEYRDQKS
ncbi:helix-turn-helix domain-containing protein [Paenibacillus illinoisensis]|uniref:response regulator transcription factor n=1 Tax=Paenibacillus illinoisensis TaxID=59845 RepID=UPI001C8DEF57|nr:helix-turn-helix domain-containing protein [Paenibacillus illinoisensis]MBY0219058.1 response regulator [Paenibacillus illinoisensis]